VFFGKADKSNGFFGGNIRNQDDLTLSDDVVAYGNTTGGSGAGISNYGGTLTVTHSLVQGNGGTSTNDSGGIQNFGPGPTSGAAGQLTVDNSTIYGNTSALGGGIMSWCNGSGGACSTDGSSLSTQIVNSTIAGNDGGARGTTGGGVLAGQGTTTLLNTILANNTVDNPTAGTANNCGVSSGAALASLGHNLAFPGTECPLSTSGDLQNTDPMFMTGAPQDLGGLTDVIALHAASPAVDAIPASASGCVGTDQRHMPRPQGPGCDIGAFELYEPVEGQSFSTLVGTVGASSGTTPSIDWGDGTTSSASYDSSQHVTGTHAYGEEGNYSGTIRYSNSDGIASTAQFDLRVQDAALTGAQSPITVAPGSALTGRLATFTDADPGGTVSDYTATVDWGDGTSSPGSVSATAGGFAVDGTHTYAKGNYNLTVSISDAGGASTQVSEIANVGAATVPVLVESAPRVGGSTQAGFSGLVNPNGLPTTAHFEYKLDSSLGGPAGTTSYDQRTPTQTVGSDGTGHPVSAQVTGLVPNATYHVRLVAANRAGTSFGSDETFRTARDPAPPPPTLARSFDAKPLSGVVFFKPPPGKSLDVKAHAARLTKGKGFVPLTEARLIPAGAQIDARAGTLQLVSATGTRRSKTQEGTFGGALFNATQAGTGISKGLTTLSLLEDAFRGAPSYSSCRLTAARAGGPPAATTARRRSSILQTLHASDRHGRFRTRGRYSAGTVRGTIWDTTDECGGTLTVVHRGTVGVLDFGRRKTITVHAGHRYLARPSRRRK
jgi:hypothetical protein